MPSVVLHLTPRRGLRRPTTSAGKTFADVRALPLKQAAAGIATAA
jgi:hypothetical protein